MSQSLDRYRATELHQAETWAGLSPEDLRRRAVIAAHRRDAEELWDLTRAYLFLHGASGARMSRHTLRTYRRGVLDLVAAWERENLLRPSHDAGVLYIRRLEATPLPATGRPPQAATLEVKLAAARLLYKALRWAGATTEAPFADVRVPRDPTPAWEKRRPYRQRDVEALLELAEPAEAVLVLLGAHGGLRIGEMTDLAWQDVDLRAGILRVRAGKGGKAGRVSMTRRLRDALENLRGLPDGRYRTRRGKDFVLPWGSGHARRRFRSLCQRAGVDYDSSGVHGLRHGAGTRYYRQTGDLGRVAAHLRHADIQTTRIYAKVDQDRIGEDIEEW